MLEHPLAQPESSLGGGLVERISDGEPAARQVPDTTLDSRLREGNTYLEHPGPGVSLDGGPMEGMSCLEPLEQSILHSSWVARLRKCVMQERSEWKSVINPAICYTLDSRPMEGITYLERSALGVSLDSGPTEGASCLEPLEQSVLSSSLAARPVEGVTEKVSVLWILAYLANRVCQTLQILVYLLNIKVTYTCILQPHVIFQALFSRSKLVLTQSFAQ